MTDFASGDQVAIKVDEYPFWPAIITDAATLGMEDLGPDFYAVQYYGTGDAGFAPKDPATVVKFDADFAEWQGVDDAGLLAAIAAAVEAGGAGADGSDGDSGEDDDAPAAAEGADVDPVAALAERERRAERKREKKEKKKKKKEKEQRKKEKEEEEKRKRKEAKKASHSHEHKKSSKQSRRDEYDETNDARVHNIVQSERRVVKKPTLSTEEVQKHSDELDTCTTFEDINGTRTVLSILCKINVTMVQLKETKLGVRLSAVLESDMYLAKPLVLLILQSWVYNAPNKERRTVMAMNSSSGVQVNAAAVAGDGNWNGAE